MNAGLLDVLEESGDEDGRTVRDGVDVDLHALEVAVDPHRAVWIHHRRRGELADEIVRRVAEVDCQPADHE